MHIKCKKRKENIQFQVDIFLFVLIIMYLTHLDWFGVPRVCCLRGSHQWDGGQCMGVRFGHCVEIWSSDVSPGCVWDFWYTGGNHSFLWRYWTVQCCLFDWSPQEWQHPVDFLLVSVNLGTFVLESLVACI